MEAVGPVLLVLSIPLMLRLVPQNPVYGFRVGSTLRDRSVWYDANAKCARHMFALGAVLVALEFVLPLSIRNTTLASIATVGVIAIVVADWRTANRWERERLASPSRRRDS